MRIRLLASPPLYVAGKDGDHTVDLSVLDGHTFIAARSRVHPEEVVCLARADHEGDDVRLAWREGVAIVETAEAKGFAQTLVRMGLAEEVTAALGLGRITANRHEP